jgi:hypothetical protein
MAGFALFAAGKIIMAGPFADGSGSLVILAAESVGAARAIFQDGPWAQRDILVAGDLKEWTIFLRRAGRVVTFCAGACGESTRTLLKGIE